MARREVLILQQARQDGPDYFLDFLARNGIAWQLRQMDRGEPVPVRAREYAGICLLGGPMSVNDGQILPWLGAQLQLIGDAMDAAVPVIGHCLGGQLMAKALGGSVQSSPQPEIGWSAVRVRPEPASRHWFGDAAVLPLFQWHGESFSIPAGATWLAETDACPHQAFSVDGIHLAMQFHCEIKADKVRLWVERHHDEIDARSTTASVQPGQQILAQLEQKLRDSQRVAEQIYSAWATQLRL